MGGSGLVLAAAAAAAAFFAFVLPERLELRREPGDKWMR